MNAAWLCNDLAIPISIEAIRMADFCPMCSSRCLSQERYRLCRSWMHAAVCLNAYTASSFGQDSVLAP